MLPNSSNIMKSKYDVTIYRIKILFSLLFSIFTLLRYSLKEYSLLWLENIGMSFITDQSKRHDRTVGMFKIVFPFVQRDKIIERF